MNDCDVRSVVIQPILTAERTAQKRRTLIDSHYHAKKHCVFLCRLLMKREYASLNLSDSNLTTRINGEDAIAIASWIELREAVQPFVLESQFVVGRNDDDYQGIPLAAWRRLAALAGEQK
jgi:hypothetical protein